MRLNQVEQGGFLLLFLCDWVARVYQHRNTTGNVHVACCLAVFCLYIYEPRYEATSRDQ
jgi:hypothetical protein